MERSAGASPSRLYFGAAGVLGLVVLLLVGLLVLAGRDDGGGQSVAGGAVGRPAPSGVSPVSYSSSPSTAAYAAIEARRDDPSPLTVAEVFPESARALDVADTDLKPELTAKKLDGDCAAAVWGSVVGDRLRDGGCTQAVRGLYVDKDAGYALTVAVFNLDDRRSADALVSVLGEGGGFVQPLSEFGQGFSMARGLAMGHYATVAWVQREDGEGGPTVTPSAPAGATPSGSPAPEPSGGVEAGDPRLLSLLIEGGKNAAVLGRAAGPS